MLTDSSLVKLVARLLASCAAFCQVGGGGGGGDGGGAVGRRVGAYYHNVATWHYGRVARVAARADMTTSTAPSAAAVAAVCDPRQSLWECVEIAWESGGGGGGGGGGSTTSTRAVNTRHSGSALRRRGVGRTCWRRAQPT